VRRFDVTAVLDAIHSATESALGAKKVQAQPVKRAPHVPGIRLLSRGKR
jgi:hypothetical protein